MVSPRLAFVAGVLLFAASGCVKREAEADGGITAERTQSPPVSNRGDQAPPSSSPLGAPPPPPATSAEISTSGGETAGYRDTDPAALTDFRPALAPYGTWSDHPDYGTVWTPSPAVAGENFAPYVGNGHWVYDHDDYTWVSDFEWGWGPFHYGRWVMIDGRWSWIPGREYAGAWVNFRVGPAGFGFVGWAPRPPTWGWRGGVVFEFGTPLRSPYVFCKVDALFAPTLAGRLIEGGEIATIAERTHVVVPFRGPSGRVVRGPAPEEIGVPAHLVVHARGDEPGIAHAREWARPHAGNGVAGHPAPATHAPPPHSEPAHEAPAHAPHTPQTPARPAPAPAPHAAGPHKTGKR